MIVPYSNKSVCIRCSVPGMGEPPIQLRDPSRLHCMVMPLCHSASQQSQVADKLRVTPPPKAGAAVCATRPVSLPACSRTLLPEDTDNGSGVRMAVPGWGVPLGYAMCGLSLCLCNLLAPGYIQTCAHVLCPVWTLSLALHIVSNPPLEGSVWLWAGVLTLLLLPFVILVGSQLFVGFYLYMFAAFSSWAFWTRLRGAPFILSWVCWGGLIVSSGLGAGVSVPPQMHLCISSFFSISLGVINSGGSDFVIGCG
jgi:hypothetical protein